MGGRRWGWRSKSMRRLRRTHGARVFDRPAGRVVHVGDVGSGGGDVQVELIRVELLIERGLGDGDGQAEFVERTLDDDLGGEVDVAELLVVTVESLGGDL